MKTIHATLTPSGWCAAIGDSPVVGTYPHKPPPTRTLAGLCFRLAVNLHALKPAQLVIARGSRTRTLTYAQWYKRGKWGNAMQQWQRFHAIETRD